MLNLVGPNAAYKPKGGAEDPKMLALWNDMNTLPTPEARKQAFVRMQQYVLDEVYAVPFGSFTKVQAVRSNVSGFVPFRIPRMSNVSFTN